MPALFVIVLSFGLGASPTHAGSVSYPLSLGANGRHIVDSGNQPVFFNAATPWHIFSRLDQQEAIAYLDDRAARGVNAMLVSLMVVEFYNGSDLNAFGEAPFLSPGDFSQPNEAYFAHVDWVMEQANERGITFFVCPNYMGWECAEQGWCPEMLSAGVSSMLEWGRWVGQRYASHPNIIWVNGCDVDADDYGAGALADAVVQGIREFDTTHLHTAHCVPYRVASDCYDRPWLDFDTSYSDCSQTPELIRENYQLPTTRPFLFIEGRYEFERDWTDVCIRSQAYWSLLGGGMGHFYGTGRVWDFPANWQSNLDSDGARAVQQLGNLIRSRHWKLLKPDYDHVVMVAGYGDITSSNYAATARASNGVSIVSYIPDQRTVTIAMDKISGSNAVAWWFHPVTGLATQIGEFSTTGTRDFTSPSDDDWVLVLDDVTAGFDPPGQGDVGVVIERREWGKLKLRFHESSQ